MNKAIAGILTALIISISIWIVTQTHLNALAISEVKSLLMKVDQKVDDGKAARHEFQSRAEKQDERLNIKIDELISRREFNEKLCTIESAVKVLSDSIATINARILKVEAKVIN